MSPSTSLSQQLSREAPRVGEYRRGSRARTTPAGTWFPAVGPTDQPAGLLLVHPGVDLKVLVPTIERLAELDLPGVHRPNPELVQQAGRNWLVTDGPPVPALADILDDGAHRTPANAAALLTDIATTLLAVHQADLTHGNVDQRCVLLGPHGTALLTDWGTSPAATPADDVRSWTALARLLTDRWHPDDDAAPQALTEAIEATAKADSDGLTAAVNHLADLAATADRATLTATAQSALTTLGGPTPSPTPGPTPSPTAVPPPKPKRFRRTAKPRTPTAPPEPPAASAPAATAPAPPAAPEPPKPDTPPAAATAAAPETETKTETPTPAPELTADTPEPSAPANGEPGTRTSPAPQAPTPPATDTAAPQTDNTPAPSAAEAPQAPESPAAERPEPSTPAVGAADESSVTPSPPEAPSHPVTPPPGTPAPDPPVTPAAETPDTPPADPPDTATTDAPAKPKPSPTPRRPTPSPRPRSPRADAPERTTETPSKPPSATPPKPSPTPRPRPTPTPPPDPAPPTTPVRLPTTPRRAFTPPHGSRPPTGRPPAPPGHPTPPGQRLPNGVAGTQPGAPVPPRRPSWQPARPVARPGQPTGEPRRKPRWIFVTFCVLTVAVVLTAAVTLFVVFEQRRGPSQLRVDAVTLWKHQVGTTCTLIGVITTNGEEGTIAYGWTSETGTGPVITEPVGNGREQVEARYDWHAEGTQTLDPVVSLQVLQPELKQVIAHPATDCR